MQKRKVLTPKIHPLLNEKQSQKYNQLIFNR